MLIKKKPFPGDDPKQKIDFSKKRDIENSADAKKPGDKKEDKKKGKKSGFWAKKAAISLAKKG